MRIHKIVLFYWSLLVIQELFFHCAQCFIELREEEKRAVWVWVQLGGGDLPAGCRGAINGALVYVAVLVS